MKFSIHRSSKITGTFREKSILWKYDLDGENINEEFIWEIPIEWMEWNIWVIVWPSGTGKSTIAKEIFWDKFVYPNFGNQSIIDELGKGKDVADITNIFNKVGFNTPKSWLKPYSVLSNGEKMRVDLANSLLIDQDIIIFDEFTSVVDRQVAKYWSYAIQKIIKKENKKFIAVGCHYDILEWLEPDWVFDTKKMTFTQGTVSPNTRDHLLQQESENEWIVSGKYLKSIII